MAILIFGSFQKTPDIVCGGFDDFTMTFFIYDCATFHVILNVILKDYFKSLTYFSLFFVTLTFRGTYKYIESYIFIAKISLLM